MIDNDQNDWARMQFHKWQNEHLIHYAISINKHWLLLNFLMNVNHECIQN